MNEDRSDELLLGRASIGPVENGEFRRLDRPEALKKAIGQLHAAVPGRGSDRAVRRCDLFIRSPAIEAHVRFHLPLPRVAELEFNAD